MLDEVYTGKKFTVIHCKKALDSYIKATKSLNGNKKKSFENAIILQILRLADGNKPMSQENFRQEGKLPSFMGRKQNSFYALKRKPIRGYCWKSESITDTYYISHYIHKNYNSLKDNEAERVCNNWRRIEVNNNEC